MPDRGYAMRNVSLRQLRELLGKAGTGRSEFSDVGRKLQRWIAAAPPSAATTGCPADIFSAAAQSFGFGGLPH